MGVLITGMHRSGTSMLAEWISQTGLGMGDGPAFETDTANPHGLFERRDVVGFNDHWLGVLGGSWWAPPKVPDQTWRSISGEQLSEARRNLDFFRARFSDWYVKDPRLSLLLPLWDRLALQTLPVVICLRPPRDVAMSLRMRDGITLRRALALWLAYNRAIYASTAGRSFLTVDLMRTLERPETTAGTVMDFLHNLGLKGSGDAFTMARSTDPGLLRQRCERLPGSAERLAEDVDEVYQQMRRLHGVASQDETFDLQLPDWAVEALDEATEVWDLQVRGEILEFHLDHERAKLEELHNALTVRLWRLIKRGRTTQGPGSSGVDA